MGRFVRNRKWPKPWSISIIIGPHVS